ncbi:MAG TPA: AraC family transcriptional regulator, partial [Pseudomonadales bacterium]|nr:AraC family transcriptional regulator [Pseudomonadales bacterium]
WTQQSLYIGTPFFGDGVSYGSHTLLASLDGSDLTIEQTDTGILLSTSIALVPAGLHIKLIRANAAFACLFLDPLGKDFSLLSHCMTAKTGEIQHGGFCDDAFLAAFNKIWHGQLSIEQAEDTIKAAFPDPRTVAFRHKVDEKVKRVLGLIAQEPSKNLSSEDLADFVGISEAQLRRVFKFTVGVPIRRYRLWHRLLVVLRLMAEGHTLTNAALESGFSDSSHFNHVFRDVFGVNPSTVLKRNGAMRVLVCNELAVKVPAKQSYGNLFSISNRKSTGLPNYRTA